MTSVPPKPPAAERKNRLKVIPSRWTLASSLVLESGHSEVDLREAVAVSARGDGQQIEIQLGHMCNNVCLFCVSGQMTQQKIAKRIALGPIVAVLEEARGRGISRVTFLGGEPTIQPTFLAALQRALDLGFSDVVIFTNLVRGREPKFLERVSKMGKFTWRISIQGGNEEAHDRVVGRSGAFKKIESGLDWLGARGHDFTANACINEDSYRSAPDYVDLVRRYGIRQLHLDMVRPGSVGVRSEEEMQHMLARYADMAGPLGVMLDLFDDWNPNFEVNIGNLPFCVLPQHAHRIVHGGEDTLTVTSDETGDFGRIWKKYEHQGSDKVHVERCGECVFRPHCRGVPEGYAALHGTEELQPLSLEDLANLDPRVTRWLETGWRPGRSPKGEDTQQEGRSPGEARALLRVVQLARRLKQVSPVNGWKFDSVQSTSPSDAEVTFSLDEASLRVKLEARPSQRKLVHVSFVLPEGIPQEKLRPVVEMLSEILRSGGKKQAGGGGPFA